MGTAAIREVWTAGALVRRHMRAALDVAGVQWREHKGWTESQFVVTGTRSQLLHAQSLVRPFGG